MAVPTLHRTPPIHQPMRGASGDARMGTTLMPDDSRALHEVATVVNDMRVLLAGVDAKLNAMVSGHADHEVRIRAVEARVPADLIVQLEDGKKFRWILYSALVVTAGVAGKVGSILPL